MTDSFISALYLTDRELRLLEEAKKKMSDNTYREPEFLELILDVLMESSFRRKWLGEKMRRE